MIISFNQLKAYYFPLFLFSAIVLGGVTGSVFGHKAMVLKPFGDIFLNLIFTAIVPLVFFSIASAVARLGESSQLLKIIFSMLITFIFTGIVAATFMIIVVKMFPPAEGVLMSLAMPAKVEQINLADQLVSIFTVPDFTKLLSHQHMLALIFFSILVGLGTSLAGERGKALAVFLDSGAEVLMRVVSLIMYYAPIGFFAYFAALVSQWGPALFQHYFRAGLIYYAAATIYFIVGFTFYAYLAARKNGIRLFWKNVPVPMLTAFATCSSAASIPANLAATKKMGVPASIYETVIPLGAILHKDGSVLGAIVKIAFLFGIFHLSFSGPVVLLTALVIALLVGTVMGAIPSGGMLGEMLILSLYGFPPQALIIIAAISIIIDPLATVLNVTGDGVCSMLVARMTRRS